MSYPSFSHFISILRAQLRHRANWLAEESKYLAKCCIEYGGKIGLEEHNGKVLYLASYLKNVGALYLSSEVLNEKLGPIDQHTSIKGWQLLSEQIARQGGLTDVAEVLGEYYQRGIPESQIASIFQVCNCWAACRTQKGYRAPMSVHDSRITLQQRAELSWSDPHLVEHFLSVFPDAAQIGNAFPI